MAYPLPPIPRPDRQVLAPASALITIGTINLAAGGISVLGRMGQAGSGRTSGVDVETAAEAAGVVTYSIVSLVSLVLAPLIIMGGVKMRRLGSYGLAKTGAIIALIPITSLCFIAGIPIGIWALVVLSKPEVRAAFNRPYPAGMPPPGPPGPGAPPPWGQAR